LRAARAAQAVQQLRVGLLGTPFQDMGDFGVDTTLMLSQWGPYVIQLSLAKFHALISKAPAAEIRRMQEADRERFSIAPDLDAETHCESLRAEWALRQLVDTERLDAFSMNFLDVIEDGRFSVMPLYAVNKLIADGLGYAGEGNVSIAAHMAQMRQLCGEANFTEIYTVDYLHNRMMMTHMQECNCSLARRDRKVRLVKKPFWAPGIAPYVGMHFTLEPGPVTLTNLTTDGHGKFYYLAYETKIIDRPPYPRYDVPHWVTELAEPVGDFLTRYSCAGGTHHLISVPGHQADTLRKLAHLQGFGFVRL
jgi:L-arabinose isomerase